MNEYGLDYKYFEGKLKLILRDIDLYTPSELKRELSSLSNAADIVSTTEKSVFLAEEGIKLCMPMIKGVSPVEGSSLTFYTGSGGEEYFTLIFSTKLRAEEVRHLVFRYFKGEK